MTNRSPENTNLNMICALEQGPMLVSLNRDGRVDIPFNEHLTHFECYPRGDMLALAAKASEDSLRHFDMKVV